MRLIMYKLAIFGNFAQIGLASAARPIWEKIPNITRTIKMA